MRSLSEVIEKETREVLLCAGRLGWLQRHHASLPIDEVKDYTDRMYRATRRLQNAVNLRMEAT